MEANWIAERSILRHLLTLHPSWSSAEVAKCLGRSLSWVKKWRKRFNQAAPDDQQILRSRSRARHSSPPSTPPEVVQRILDLRDQPPENLQRVPGPRALLYYLPRHREGLPEGVRLPRSTRTIWKILRQHHRIAVDRRRISKPLERPEPLQEIQMDFKDDSTVPAEPLGKRQHVVETCNFVDAGTSIWLHAIVREDFTAETAFDTLVEFLQRYGLPAMLTFDRDPRWVGSASGRDFPSVLVRFLLCLGIGPNICPPHRPDKNCYVERLHRTYKYEWRLLHRPATAEQVTRPSPTGSCTITTRSDPIKDAPVTMCRRWSPFRPCRFYLPFPSRWIRTTGSRRIHGRAFARTVRSDGTVTVDDMRYYVKQELAGQVINLIVDAPDKVFDLFHGANRLKRLPLKGLYGSVLPVEEYVTLMRQEARSDRHRPQFTSLGLHQTSLWA